LRSAHARPIDLKTSAKPVARATGFVCQSLKYKIYPDLVLL
jgi:hypothetical protein